MPRVYCGTVSGPRDKGRETRILTWTWMAEIEAEMKVMMGRPQKTGKPAEGSI